MEDVRVGLERDGRPGRDRLRRRGPAAAVGRVAPYLGRGDVREPGVVLVVRRLPDGRPVGRACDGGEDILEGGNRYVSRRVLGYVGYWGRGGLVGWLVGLRS